MNISVYEAKSRLSEMIKKALDGETVIITRSGTPVVQLTPVSNSEKWVGMDEGNGKVLDSFFEPFEDDETIKYLTGETL